MNIMSMNIDPAFGANRIDIDGVIDRLGERNPVNIVNIGSAAVNGAALEMITSEQRELQEVRSANIEDLTEVSDYIYQFFDKKKKKRGDKRGGEGPDHFRVDSLVEAKLLQSFVLWGARRAEETNFVYTTPFLMIGKRAIEPSQSGLPDTELLLASRETWAVGKPGLAGSTGIDERISIFTAKTWANEVAAIEGEQDKRLSSDYTDEELRAMLDQDKLNNGHKELVIKAFVAGLNTFDEHLWKWEYGEYEITGVMAGATVFKMDHPADTKLPRHRERLTLEERMQATVEHVGGGRKKEKTIVAGGPLIVGLHEAVRVQRYRSKDQAKYEAGAGNYDHYNVGYRTLKKYQAGYEAGYEAFAYYNPYNVDYTQAPKILGNQAIVNQGNVVNDFNVVNQLARISNAEKLLRHRFGESQD